MSTQEFNEPVGQVIQAETVTQVINDGGRALTQHERRALNDRVRRLEGEFDENGAAVWRTTHAALGIQNIEEMRLGHYDAAVTLLDLMLERAELKQTLSQSNASSKEGGVLLEAQRRQNAALERELKKAKSLSTTLFTDLEQAKKALGDKDLQLFNLTKDYQQIRQIAVSLHKRKKRMVFTTAVSLLVMTGAVAGMAYQTRQAGAAASACELNGKYYPVGSAMPGRPDGECGRFDDGRAEWRMKGRGKNKGAS